MVLGASILTARLKRTPSETGQYPAVEAYVYGEIVKMREAGLGVHGRTISAIATAAHRNIYGAEEIDDEFKASS
jgi:hypothetical protein